MTIKVKLILPVFLAALLVLFQGIAMALIVPVQITNDAGNQGRPDVQGNVVVWKGNQAGNWNIYAKDLSTGLVQDICLNPSAQNLPVTNGSAVVWQDSRNGTEDIYWKNVSGGAEQLLVSGPGNQGLSDISGDTVVYIDNSAGNNNIYAKDLGAAAAVPVCTDPASQWQPRMSGTRVVWEDNRNGNWDIYMKDVSTGIEQPVVVEAGDQKVSDIDGDIVVWQDHRTSRYDIWMKDLSTGVTGPVTDDAAYQSSPRVSGDLVVWEDYRNDANPSDTYYDYDIYMKDLSTGIESQLAYGTAIQARPAVDRETVVWESDPGNGNYDVWMATVPDEIPPAISALAPVNGMFTGCSAPTVSANYSDNRTGIDTGSVQLLIDGDNVTADPGATVTGSGVAYHPPNPIAEGSHAAFISVTDQSGNTATASWEFSTSSPALSLSLNSSFWASYADYTNRELSVSYSLANVSIDTAARSVKLLQSPATAGVVLASSTPLALGDLTPGQDADAVARYLVPTGVTFFRATVYSSCEDNCGSVYYFPGPPPEL